MPTNNTDTAPLTADVVTEWPAHEDCKHECWFAPTLRTLVLQIKGDGDRITAIATQLAETDRLLDNARQIERNVQAVREHEHKRAEAALAELARVTAERDQLVKIDVARDGEHRNNLARIAALTEALKTVQDDCYFYKLDAETMFSVEQVLALTTDKEPKT